MNPTTVLAIGTTALVIAGWWILHILSRPSQ